MRTSKPFNPSFWRLALAGVVAGVAVYLFPFLLAVLAVVLLVGSFLRLVFGSGRGYVCEPRAYSIPDQPRNP